MNPREHFLNEEVGGGNDDRNEQTIKDFVAVLDDYLDEEVVDKEGAPVGILACYWVSAAGRPVFLGVRLNGDDSVRLVLGRRSQVDERRACIRLGFSRADIETAPTLDCAQELNAALEQAVYQHFRIANAPSAGQLKRVAAPVGEVNAQKAKGGSPDISLPNTHVQTNTECPHVKTPTESTPLHHTQQLKAEMTQLIEHLRGDISKVTCLQAQALFETSAEVLTGLVKAFDDYEKKNEAAWKSDDEPHP